VTDRTVRVRLEAVTSQYTAAMARAGQSTTNFAKGVTGNVGKAARSLEAVSTEATIAGGALIGIGVASVAASTRFDKQMSAVQAATKSSVATMERLRQSALDAGAATAFSATEAAQGQEELAKAGVSTADILGGALKGALDLAAAGGTSVANSAEIAATALTVFGLKGSDVAHVADLLAAGAGKAQGSVDDMGMALKQSALVAKQTGLSVEDTTGALAQFASAGLIGSDAGTSFKTMLQRLTPQSEEAADLMKKLGINAYDAQGQFIGLEAFAGKLRAGLVGLSAEQRNAALATIFGSDSVRAAAVLYEGGAEGVRKWRDAVNDSGYASEQAAIRLDNLAGDFEQLSGSIETTFIKSGSTANGLLRTLTQGATDAVNAVGNLPTPVLAVGVAVTTTAGAFLLLGPRVVASAEALQLLAARAPRATAAIVGVGKAAGVTAASIYALSIASDKVRDFTGNTVKGSQESADALLSVGDAAGFTSDEIKKFGGAGASLKEILDGIFNRDLIGNANGFVTTVSSLGGVLPWADEDVVKQGERFFESVDSGLVQLASSGRADEAARKFQLITDAAREQGISIDQIQKLLPGYSLSLETLNGAATGAAGANGAVAQTIADADAAAKAAEQSIKDLEDAMDSLRGGAQSADEATADLEKSFADAAEAAKDMTGAVTKGGKSLDLTKESGRKAQAALGGITDALFDAVPAWKANGDSAKVVQQRVTDARIEFIKQATQMGLTKDAAKRLADQYGLIPSKILTEYSTPGADAAKKAAEDAAKAIAGIPRNVAVKIVVSKSGSYTTGQGQSTKPAAAAGGFVYGPGTMTSDSIDARLSNGEHVTRAAIAQANKPLMTAINEGRMVDAFTYLAGKTGSSKAAGVTFVSQVTAAPGEHAEESVPRAHQRMAFLAGFGG